MNSTKIKKAAKKVFKKLSKMPTDEFITLLNTSKGDVYYFIIKDIFR